jgi:CHRD domain
MRRRMTALVAGACVLGMGTIAVAADSTFLASLSSGEEVPANDSLAVGNAVFHLREDGTELDFKLIVANIRNVVQAHIHLGPEGTNGPVVAFLYGPVAPAGGRVQGPIGVGTITAADLRGPLAGQPLSDLTAAIESGNAYVNVHTSDGDPATPAGPGDLPGGEIRGQMD